MRVSLALLLGLSLAACADEAAEVPLSFQILATCLKVPQPTEQVFRTAEDLRGFWARYPATSGEPMVDFSRSLVAARFDGGGSACVRFSVESVGVRDGQVRVEATRHASPDVCIAVLAYPQLVLAVERRDLPVVFAIRDARDNLGQTVPCF